MVRTLLFTLACLVGGGSSLAWAQPTIPALPVSVRDAITNTIGATVSDLTNSEALHVYIVDANGDQITSFGGSPVTHIDDAAFTVASDDIAPAGFMFDDTSPDSVDEGDAGIPRMSANRNPYTTIRDAAGNERGVNVTAANELLVELGAGSASVGVLGSNTGVDIGDVDVTSQIPGTGATNLGKAIGTAVGATDTGVMLLAVHTADAVQISVTEEQFGHLHVGELGGLFVEPEQHNHFDEMDATTGWTVLGNDTINLLTTTNHLTGTLALTFDKTDGDDNTIFAGIQKTITTLDMGELDLHDVIQTVCYISSIAEVAYVFVRVGTDASNYNEWRVADTDIVAGDFIILGLPLGAASQAGSTGTGLNPAAISYIAVGVAFDNTNDALSGIIFDQIGVFTVAHTATSISAEVTSSVSTPNINLQRIGGSITDKGAGNVSNGSQRVVLASDQNFVHLEDSGSSQADAGVMVLARRTASPADTSNADTDYETLQLDNGRLWVSATIDAALPTGSATIGEITIGTATTAATDLAKAEDVAHATGDVGMAVWAIRDDSPPAATSAAGDYEPFHTDAFGALWTRLSICGDASLVTSVAIDTASSGNVELVALTTNETIFICGYNVMSAGTTEFQLVFGTGTACATGETNITGNYNLIANTGIAIPNTGAIQAKGDVSEAVCVENSAAVAIDGILTYVKMDITP